jgi:cell wall-associated NlpC family hydrolase
MWNFTSEEIQEKRELIVIEAKKLLNIPFRHNGRTRFGLDCLGLLYVPYKRAGIDLPSNDGRSYIPDWYKFCDNERYLDKILEFSHFIDNPLKADVLTFKCFKPKVTHVGIYLGDNLFIHCPSLPNPTNSKVKIDSLDDKVWNRMFYKFVRFNGFKIEENNHVN